MPSRCQRRNQRYNILRGSRPDQVRLLALGQQPDLVGDRDAEDVGPVAARVAGGFAGGGSSYGGRFGQAAVVVKTGAYPPACPAAVGWYEMLMDRKFRACSHFVPPLHSWWPTKMERTSAKRNP